MSMAGLKQFNMDLNDFYRHTVPEKHDKIVKKIAMQVLEGVVKGTPVDTGRARGAWTVTTGSPSEEVPPMKEGHIPEKKAETEVRTETIGKGTDIIKAAKPAKEVIWIANNVPYIEELEDGSSKQSPAGMLESTLERVKSQL